MNRIWRSLLLLSFLCASICAQRILFSTKTNSNPTVCLPDKHRSCSYYRSNGYCNSNAYRNWMRVNCAQTCGYCSTSTGASSQNGFKIHSSAYKQCLTVNLYSNSVYLSNCDQRSTRQTWRWISGGRLQATLGGKCLAVTSIWGGYLGRSYGASLQPCYSVTSDQQWVCTGGYLKIKNKNLYLIPFLYGDKQKAGGIRISSSATNTCLWSRYGSTGSVCTNASTTQTTPRPTTQVTTPAPQTTPRPTTQVTTRPSQNGFQIHSSAYKKCLTANVYSNSVYLSNCVRRSSAQTWRWISGGRLQATLGGKCLAVTSIWRGYLGRSYGASLQPCYSLTSDQQWVCTGDYLKLKNKNLYLIPFLYSSKRIGGVIVRSSVTNSCLWSRYGTSKSICISTVTKPSTTLVPTTAVTTRASQNGFQILSSAYKKCLTVNLYSNSVYLSNCVQQSTRQTWRWISGGRLQSTLAGKCLAVTSIWRGYLGRSYGESLQPCYSVTSDQQWVCTSGYLKLKNKNLYLTPFLYSSERIGGVRIGSSVTNMYLWSRYGTSKSICASAVTKPPTTLVPTTTVTTITPQNSQIQIKNTRYNKCLALRNKTNLSLWLRKNAPDLTLENCDRNSPRQLWQYTSSDQLKLSYNGMCLTYDSTTRIHFQPCTTLNENQRWRCIGNKLMLKTKLQYLVSFMYSGLPYGYDIKTLWYCAFNSCSWSRFDTGLSVCSNEKGTTTTTPVTTQITSIQPITTATPPVSSTDNTGTSSRPTTDTSTTPPVPPNTPPVPPLPESTPPVPPLPGSTPPVPPFPGNTPPVPPFPGNTPSVPPFPGNTDPVPPFPGNTPSVVATTKPPPPEGNKNIRCGTKGPIGGVVNGTIVAAGSSPWQVGIRKCADCDISCGGTLINDEWVVTAAHCVSGWFADDLYLVTGEVDQSRKSGHEQQFRCSKIIMHEDYAVDAPYDKDIALLQLDKYAVFNDHVRPLCLPGKDTVLTENDLCVVTGFGRVTQNGAKSARLLEANIKIVPQKTCAQSYASLPIPRKVTSNMLCAGYKKGGTDACQGDSGGPLTCYDRQNFRFILGGVVSWGVGCARPELYGVYSNTAFFTPWVEKKLAPYGY